MFDSRDKDEGLHLTPYRTLSLSSFTRYFFFQLMQEGHETICYYLEANIC